VACGLPIPLAILLALPFSEGGIEAALAVVRASVAAEAQALRTGRPLVAIQAGGHGESLYGWVASYARGGPCEPPCRRTSRGWRG